jgi:hypothetical protein
VRTIRVIEPGSAFWGKGTQRQRGRRASKSLATENSTPRDVAPWSAREMSVVNLNRRALANRFGWIVSKRRQIDYGKNLLFGLVSKDVHNGAKAAAFLRCEPLVNDCSSFRVVLCGRTAARNFELESHSRTSVCLGKPNHPRAFE